MSAQATTPSSTEATLRQDIVEHGRRFAPAGLSQGTSGNLSVRWRQGDVDGLLITPSGVDYTRMGTQDLPFMRLDDGSWSGPLKPSSEWRFHRDIYLARPEVGAIVHAHPTHATALAVQRRELPAFHYMVAVAGGDSVPCTPYHLFGTEALSQAVGSAFADRNACLMANHGLVAGGASLAQALKVAMEIEALCGIYLQALAVGEPALLSAAQMAEVMAKFKTYGKARRA